MRYEVYHGEVGRCSEFELDEDEGGKREDSNSCVEARREARREIEPS